MNSPAHSPSDPKKSEEELFAELDELNKEAAALNELRIRLETELSRAKAEKEALEKELVLEFGTCEPDKVKAEIQERIRHNRQAVEKYRQELCAFKASLQELNNELAKIR